MAAGPAEELIGQVSRRGQAEMRGGLPGGPEAGSLAPCPYVSCLQFRVAAVDAVLAGQSGERQVPCQAELGPVLLREIGDQDGSGKESRKLRAGVPKIEIGDADAGKRNGIVERASVHGPANQGPYARLLLLDQDALVAFDFQRPQS